MLLVNQLTGFGAFEEAAAVAQPASFVFNGVDKYLARTLSTSGASTTIFTYSLWIKVIAYSPGTVNEVWQVINAPTFDQFLFFDISSSGDQVNVGQDAGSAVWGEVVASLSPNVATGTWEHWVIRYDSTQGTADNRLRFYRNGTLLTDGNLSAGQPGASEAHIMFANGFQHQIGAYADLSAFSNQKLAFIDVLEGVSAAPTDFAFNNGGTWTRMPYAGSYGTYGFSLDGTGVFNDVSGNGQHFIGVNMDASDLDTGDLPPHTI